MATRLLLDLVHTAGGGNSGGKGFAADEMADLSYRRAIAAALTVAGAPPLIPSLLIHPVTAARPCRCSPAAAAS